MQKSFIDIEVTSFFKEDLNKIIIGEYYFEYRIDIKNIGKDSMQLLRREWIIFDSIIGYKKISGEGVVGLQPILLAGENFSYSSYCVLRSDIGQMQGFYIFLNLTNNLLQTCKIPSFNLIAKFREN